MFKSEDSTERVATRLRDYFGRRTPWQRRLWNVGSVLALNETIEAAEQYREGHLRQGSLRDLSDSLKKRSEGTPESVAPNFAVVYSTFLERSNLTIELSESCSF